MEIGGIKEEIKIEIKIEKNDINEKIFFINNSEEYHSINIAPYSYTIFNSKNQIEEYKKSNIEIYINDIKYEIKKYFILIKKVFIR